MWSSMNSDFLFYICTAKTGLELELVQEYVFVAFIAGPFGDDCGILVEQGCRQELNSTCVFSGWRRSAVSLTQLVNQLYFW